MNKKWILMLAVVGGLSLFGCTSSQSSDEGAATDEMADAGEVGADAGEALGEEGAQIAEEGNDLEMPAEDGALENGAESLNEEMAAKDSNATGGEQQIAPVLPEENQTTTETAQIQPIEPTPVEPPPQVLAPEPPAETQPVEPSYEASSSQMVEEAPKPVLPLRKVEATPWKVGKTLMNTVYLARPKDTWKSVSQKIFGENRTSELKKGNAWMSRREVRPGDKIYFNSPNRPTDDSRVLTFYEDKGVAPEIYVAHQGDNLRKVASSLLGFDQAWKEVWATNSVESKGMLSEGTELRYWKSSSGEAISTGAIATTETSQQAADTHQQQPAMDNMPQEALAQPNVGGGAGVGTPGEMPPPPADAAMPPPAMEPPPPPMEEMAPPPPPQMAEPVAAEPAHQNTGGVEGMLGDDLMTYGLLGGVAVIALVWIIIRNKRRQKELEDGFQDTQVG